MRDKISLVYIIDEIVGDLGGTESQLIKLVNGLSKDRFRVCLVCFDNPTWFRRNASVFQCETTVFKMNRFKRPSTYASFLRLMAFLRDYRPHIVHTFFPVSNVIGVLASRLAGVKNIVSSRRDYGEWMNPQYTLATRIANKWVRKIVVNSHGVRKLTEEVEGVDVEKIEVLHNGIDPTLFQNMHSDIDLMKRLDIPPDDKVVGIVGNFRPMKHHETFIRAAHEILAAKKNVKFVLVGGAATAEPIQQQMMELGKTLGIEGKLRFCGAQGDVRPYLSIMDVGVNCSEREGLSNAVMEYMAAGVPCVVSNAGGNPDLITHDVEGLTFGLDDYKTLASHVLRLLGDKELRERLSTRAREKVGRKMSLHAMISNYEWFYKSLVDTIIC